MMANYKLVNEDNFILFVDIKRARFSGIKPLPQRIKTSDGWEIVEVQEISRFIDAPDSILVERLDVPEQTTAFTKQKLWERKLLDLSLRNNPSKPTCDSKHHSTYFGKSWFL